MQNELIEITRGQDKVWILTVALQDGSVVDITDCSFVMIVRENQSSAVFLQKSSSVAGEIDLVDPLNGVAEITFDAADTAGLENTRREYQFDIWVTKPTGKKQPVTQGKLTVLASVKGDD